MAVVLLEAGYWCRCRVVLLSLWRVDAPLARQTCKKPFAMEWWHLRICLSYSPPQGCPCALWSLDNGAARCVWQCIVWSMLLPHVMALCVRAAARCPNMSMQLQGAAHKYVLLAAIWGPLWHNFEIKITLAQTPDSD